MRFFSKILGGRPPLHLADQPAGTRSANRVIRSTIRIHVRRPTRSLLATNLREYNYLALHAHVIMKSTDVRKNPRTCKGPPEARDARRRLSEPDPILPCPDNAPPVHAVRRRTH